MSARRRRAARASTAAAGDRRHAAAAGRPGRGPRRRALPAQRRELRRDPRRASDRGGKVVVVGAGWIGSEAAASARAAAGSTSRSSSRPPSRSSACSAPRWALSTATLHAEHGVELLLGTGVDALEGAGAVERVRTSDGRDGRLRLRGRRHRRRAGDGARRARRPDASTTASSSTARCARARPASSRRATWRATNTRCYGPAARRALVQRPAPGPRRRAQHARQRRALRPDPVLLLRPVRRRHGVLRQRERRGPRVVVRGDTASGEFIAFWLDEGACSSRA